LRYIWGIRAETERRLVNLFEWRGRYFVGRYGLLAVASGPLPREVGMAKIIEMTTALALAALLARPVEAQQGKGIEVNPVQRQSGVELTLELKSREGDTKGFRPVCDLGCVQSGPMKMNLRTEVAICFTATADGYVTVWNIDSKGGFDRIYPNAYSHAEKTHAAAVKANATTCIGEDENFRLNIAPPLGISKVYLHWTRTEAEQIGIDDYPVPGKDARLSPPYASTTLPYEIVGN
jgi:hypothetical protein